MNHNFLIGDGQFVCDEIQYIYNTTVSSHCLIYLNIYNKVNLKNTLSQNKYQHYFIQSTYKEFYQMIWIPHVELTLRILLRWQTILFGIPYGVSVYNVIIEIQESLVSPGSVSPVYPVSQGSQAIRELPAYQYAGLDCVQRVQQASRRFSRGCSLEDPAPAYLVHSSRVSRYLCCGSTRRRTCIYRLVFFSILPYWCKQCILNMLGVCCKYLNASLEIVL